MNGHNFKSEENKEIKMVMSGLTKEFGDLNNRNYGKIKDALEWEDLASIKQTSELLEQLQDIPLYWYKMNYLMYTYREKFQGEEAQELIQKWENGTDFKKEFFTYIGKAVRKELKRSAYADSDYEKLIDMIINCMKEDRDIFYPQGKVSDGLIFDTWSQEQKNLDSLFNLALIVNMSEETFEEFLKKGMRRSGFNFYNPNEVIMYCVLKYGEAGMKKESFQALKEFYSHLEACDSGNRYNYSLEIKEKIDDKLRNIDGYRLFRDTSCKEISPEMKELLQALKNSEPDTRTILEVYQDLKEKAIFRNGWDILSYDQQTDMLQNCAKGKLQIKYDGNKITIPKKTQFYFLEKRPDANEEEEKYYKVKFITTENKILPKKEGISVGEVEVESLTPESTFDRNGEKVVVPSNTIFSQEEGKELPGILEITNGTRRIKAVQESVRLSMLRIDNSKLFRFLYSEIDDPKDDGSVRRSMVSVGNSRKKIHVKKEMLGKWFLDTKFGKPSTRTRNEKVAREIYISRSDILTLAFLAFLGDAPVNDKAYREELKSQKAYIHEDSIAYYTMQYSKKNGGKKPGSQDIYDYFTDQADRVLEECGMQPFDLANPYDCLLAYLLLSDEPINVLRQLWRIALE